MIERLLFEISAITKKYDIINQKTGAYFNIFDIADISYDELKICRIIYELINPNGCHFQGITYLKLFVENVLKMNFSDKDYSSARVFREYGIVDNRRIDLFIQTENYQIPIEVKINAYDQNKQCYDYYKYAVNSDVFYLTLLGQLPSNESADGLTPKYDENRRVVGYEGITTISFDVEIIDWINRCISDSNTIKISSIREILLQFKDTISKLSGFFEEGSKVEVVEAILSTPDNIRSAIDIEKSLPYVKAKIMRNFFYELKCLFEDNGFVTYDYDETIFSNYYLSRSRVYPCLSVKIKDLTKDVMATLCVEVDYNLYSTFAFTKADNANNSCEYLDMEWVRGNYPKEYIAFTNAVTKIVEIPEKQQTKTAFCWEYIFSNKGEKYDFKNFSPSCIDLANDYKIQANKAFELLSSYIKRITEVLQ